uniref:Uncharacterized protein n=1 Tax=Alexandrium monilatum TaxID=311494 RepID=A0A7S4Q1A7_9DINO
MLSEGGSGVEGEAPLEGGSTYWSNLSLEEERPVSSATAFEAEVPPAAPTSSSRTQPEVGRTSRPGPLTRARSSRPFLEPSGLAPALRPVVEEPSLPRSIFVIGAEGVPPRPEAAPPASTPAAFAPAVEGRAEAAPPACKPAASSAAVERRAEATPPTRSPATRTPAVMHPAATVPPAVPLPSTAPAAARPALADAERPRLQEEVSAPGTPSSQTSATAPGPSQAPPYRAALGYRPQLGDEVDEGVAEFLNQPRNRLRRSLLCRLGPGDYLYGTRHMSLRLVAGTREVEASENGATWEPLEDFVRRLERSQSNQLHRAWERARAGPLPQPRG